MNAIIDSESEFTIVEAVKMVYCYKWLFLGVFILILTLFGGYCLLQKHSYQSVCEVQYFRIDKILQGYDEQPQSIINKMKRPKTTDCLLSVQLTPEGTVRITADGPTAKVTYSYLLKSVHEFVKQKNKADNKLIQLYIERLAKDEQELKVINEKLESHKFPVDKQFDTTSSILFGSKIALEQESVHLRENIMMLQLCSAKIISSPTVGIQNGHKASTILALATILGILCGTISTVLYDYILRNIKNAKSDKTALI